MIKIRPIRADEIQSAKYIILKVAYGIFGWDGTLDESIQHFESSGDLQDIDHFQAEYFDRDGIFLAVLDDEKLIGSGAIRKMDNQTAELKRMWLLESYHGQRVGYRLIQELFDFARKKGYRRVRLQTSPQQTRAIDFYQRVGFHEIPSYNNDTSEISMEITLSGTNLNGNPSSLQPKETQ
jgi:putative acetyltransferase